MKSDCLNIHVQASKEMTACSVCPRKCGADRVSGNTGFCSASSGFDIASICIHKGEEPVISGKCGICNVFFSGCNLQCTYCQNKQISINTGNAITKHYSLNEAIAEIETCLDKGCESVGFVSPSHMIPQIKLLITGLRNNGRNPVFVYNSNAYDDVDQLKSLEGLIDIYLPDFKYSDNELAFQLSEAKDYVSVAMKSLNEMYRQKGNPLHVNAHGFATSGLIIRHLVLPGFVNNSIEVLRIIAEELSPRIHVSLMSQYYPVTYQHNFPSLNRRLSQAEYNQVADAMEEFGIINGWVQELESGTNYLPDFNYRHPFEYSCN